MPNPSADRPSWLSAGLVVLLIGLTGVLLKGVWDAGRTEPRGRPTEDFSDDEPDHPDFSYDESLAILGDPNAPSRDRIWAAKCVSRKGREAIPDLLTLLDHDSKDVRAHAIAILGSMGSVAADAGPRLLPLCEDPDLRMRQAAILAAWDVLSDRSLLKPALKQALRSEHQVLATTAMDYLCQFESPPLEDLFWAAEHGPVPEHGLMPIRNAAAERLAGYATRDRKLLLQLLEKRQGFPSPIGNQLFRHWKFLRPALEDIVAKAPRDEVYLSALLTLVRAPREGNRSIVDEGMAQKHFEQLARAAEDYRDSPLAVELPQFLHYSRAKALPALRELVKSKNPETRGEAAYYWASIDPTAVELLPVFQELLVSDLPAHRIHLAIWGVQKLRDAGQAAIPELEALVDDPRPGVSEEARLVLKEWGVAVEPTMEGR